MEEEKPFPVFVDNIEENVKTKDLRKVFARCGLVKEVTIISHYGFVNFRSPDDAVAAIESCNNYILLGKKLKVEASEELDNFLKQREESFELSMAKRRKSVDQNYHYNQHPRTLTKVEENYVNSISPNLHGVQFQRPNNHFIQHDTQRSSSRSRCEEERVPIKRKLRVHSSSSIGSSSGDLRNIIVHSKKPKIADKVEAVKKSASPEPKPVQIKPEEFDNVQELQVGNLLNQVEKSDLEQLLDGYGDIKGVGMFKDHAVVLVECSHDTAQEAIESLDQSYWMDNTINVKFHRIKPENLKKEEERRRSRSRSKSKSSRPESSVGEQLSPVSHNTEEKQRSRSSSAEQEQILDQIVYEVWIWSPGIKKDQFTDDMVDQIGEYGTVQDKHWEEKDQSIVVQTLCTVPQIIECLTKLNNDPYPYKEIRAKFPNASDHEASLASLIDNYPFKLHSDTFQPVSSTSSKPATSSIDKKIKTREIWLWTPAINAKKSFLQDMAPIVSQYGKVKDQGWKEDELSFVYFNLESSEKQAAKCISETHGLRYKATDVRAKYADGSPDENLYKDQAYAILLRNYDPILIPESYKAKMRMVEIERKSKSPTPPPKTTSPIQKGQIKMVLPSRPVPARRRSSAHEAFDEVLNQEEDLDDNKLAKTLAAASSTMALNPKARIIADAVVIESVGGKIYSVSSKVILIEFRVANSFGNSAQRFARLKPGQMFVDGQKNLGYMTQKLRYPDWPEDIKEIFRLGNEVVMDVRRLSRTEEEEVRELTSEVVFYEAALVWKTTKPSNLIKNQSQPLFKATVIKLWPKWAILQPLIYNGGQNLILMLREEYHSPEAGQDSIQSLLSHIEIGDTLAVLANPKEYLDMVEKAQPLEFFKERTNHLKYETVLAWPVVSEIDPYNVLRKKKQASMAEADELENSSKHVSFLATSNCLNLPLPDAKEATYKKWTGYIEQLNLPGGGVVRLTESTSQSWAPEKQRVYFHRARLHINGPRMESKAILEDEVALGDPVTVDVIANQVDMTTTYMSGTDIFWMALSVKVNTADRGLTLANRLRAEGVDPSVYATKVCQGRVVYLKPPNENESSVCAGTAVIDSGPHTGQRIEFEAEQCFLFGYSLSRVDLSFIFQSNEPVCIMVKPYNSYIIDKLWIGSDVKNNPHNTDGRMQLQKFLFDHGLDKTSFELFLKGTCPSRPFIPLEGQVYSGKIKGLKSDDEGHAITAVIEANVGELLFMEAPKESIFVYGHCMGKADLRYLFEAEEVCFEIHPVFAKEEHMCRDVPQTSLVWLGDESCRPKYSGQTTKPIMTEQMDTDLWEFVGSKQMDVKMFKALVEGRLPPKEKKETKTKRITTVETPDGQTVEVDDEDLAQAALFKQMKTQFGNDALMKAMMQLVKQSQDQDK